MTDAFRNRADDVSAPANRAVAVVPSDGVALADVPKALFVGSGGTLVMRGDGDVADTSWRNIPSGSIVPFRARYVRATGTSATDVLALY